MVWLVVYDIRNDRRRRRIEKILKRYGLRVQYSVFECDLDARAYVRLRDLLGAVADDEDSVRFYGLCDGCAERVDVLSAAEEGIRRAEPVLVM